MPKVCGFNRAERETDLAQNMSDSQKQAEHRGSCACGNFLAVKLVSVALPHTLIHLCTLQARCNYWQQENQCCSHTAIAMAAGVTTALPL